MSHTKLPLPILETGSRTIDRAFRIALGDIAGNVRLHSGGILEEESPALMAGLDYGVWTRDSAINAWNGASLLLPEVSRDTLLSLLERDPIPGKTDLQKGGQLRIGGQYWDAIIWTSGAWSHYLFTGDRRFLDLALEATRNSLAHFEETEFDASLGLFRGPACYGDGISAYPDAYARTNGESEILAWPHHNPEKVSRPGKGLPMFALSTNCLYKHAYGLASRMAAELGQTPDPQWKHKEAALRDAIRRRFWDSAGSTFRYLVDPLFGDCGHQEGLGLAFAILCGVADDAQAEAVLSSAHVTKAGFPCVWPAFKRYVDRDGASYGRHSGSVWPFIQAFWAEAAARHGRGDLLAYEFLRMTEYANRDAHFNEIYHPDTGLPYGGIQEIRPDPKWDWVDHMVIAPATGLPDNTDMHLWTSCARQTWSATGYLRILLTGVFGMEFCTDGIRFQPLVPAELWTACAGKSSQAAAPVLRLKGLPYRGMRLDIELSGRGEKLVEAQLEGRILPEAFLSATGEGLKKIALRLGS